MPLIQCPSCSAQLNIKDELAGRRVKCPKCETPIDVPVADPPPLPLPTPPSGPVAARVVKRPVAAVPPPEPAAAAAASLSFDADEPPPPRKGRREDDDDRPKRRSKAPRDDDEDDEKPRKKKSNTLLFLGIGGAVLFVLCGGCGFGIFRAMMEVGEGIDSLAEKNELVNSANTAKLKPGMTKPEVESILGPGRQLGEYEMRKILENSNNQSKAKEYIEDWLPWIKKGYVQVWRNRSEHVFVAYAGSPDSDGTLKGLSHLLNTGNTLASSTPIPLPSNLAADADAVRLGIASPDRTTPVDPQPSTPKNSTPPKAGPAPTKVDFEVTALGILNEFIANSKTADEKYRGKKVKIAGTVRATVLSGSLTLLGKTDSGQTYQVVLLFPANQRQGITDLKTNAAVSVVGTVGAFAPSGKTKSTSLTISDCQLAP